MVGDNRILIIISLFLMSSFGCTTNTNLSQINKTLKEVKLTFGIEFSKSNLLNHFPNNIKNDSIYFRAFPPSCPPTYECNAQFGDVYYIVNKSDYQKELNTLLNNSFAYITPYTTDNIIINFSTLRQNIFPVQKCNNWYAKQLPIPYFEDYDFGLGKIEHKKSIGNEKHFNYTYTIPDDLKVYVIKAEAGDFWIESCNEKRPLSLKEWQHGYSKGIAVSKEENVIVYWVMLW